MSTTTTGRGRAPAPATVHDDLSTAGFTISPPQRSTTTLLDTFDGRFHRARLRLEHGGRVLRLRGPGDAVASIPAEVAPARAADVPAGPLRERIRQVADVRALMPITTISTTNRVAERRDGEEKVTVRVAVHQDLAVDGRVIDGWFVQVDELTGYARQAAAARELLEGHVASVEAGDALDLGVRLGDVAAPAGQVGPGIPLDPDAPAIEGFRLVLVNLADAIEANRDGTIDDVDPEFLHDLRVAVRRTRSVVRHGRHVLPADVLAWAEPGLREIGRLTGPPRDLDVQVIEWAERVAALGAADRDALEPLRRQLQRDRDAAQAELAGALRAGAAADTLERWSLTVRSAMDPATGGPSAATPLHVVARDRIERAQRQLLAGGRAVEPATPAEAVHEVRKQAKQLRYLLECFAALYRRRDRTAFVKHLKQLQELLGVHQDVDVQAAQLRVGASELPASTGADTLVAIGRLVEQLETRRHEARDQFASRFADYDSGPTRRSLRVMLDGARR